MIDFMRLTIPPQPSTIMNPQYDTVAGFDNLKITQELNQPDTLEFELPLSNRTAPLLSCECILTINGEVAEDDFYQTFIIKNISADVESGIMTVYAVADVSGLTLRNVRSYKKENATAYTIISEQCSGASWTVEYGSSQHPSRKATVEEEFTNRFSIISSAVEKCNVEVEYDCINRKIKLYDRGGLGDDSGKVIFWEELNALGISVEEDSSESANHIWAYGKESGEDGERVTAVSPISGFSFIDETYDLGHTSYVLHKKIEGYYIDDDEEDAEALYESALEYLRTSHLPKYSFDVSVADLAMVDTSWAHFNFRLGDTVRLMSSTLADRVNGVADGVPLRIVKIERYPNDPSKTTIEVSNTRATLDSIVAKTVKTVSNNTDSFGKPLGKAVVVDSGASGGWHWKKYSDGTYDAWFSGTGSMGTVTAWGTVGCWSALVTTSLPTAIGSKSITTAEVTPASSSYLIDAVIGSISEASFTWRYVRFGSTATATDIKYMIYCHGKW